jgi:hypothetical protein
MDEYYMISEAEADALIERLVKEAFPDFNQEKRADKDLGSGDSLKRILADFPDLFNAGTATKS